VTLHTALLQGTKLLDEAGIAVPRLTAEVLLCHAIGREREYLYAPPEEELTELGWIHYGRYLHERLKGKPTQYITRRQQFYGREFVVGPDVLIPRPETEHLVEAVLSKIRREHVVVDIGTGSGAIAITLALESGARVYATDISTAALRVAALNAHRLHAPVAFCAADLASCFAPARVNILVSNPPYVPRTDQPSLQREVRDYEPELALYGGPDGLDFYQRIIAQAPVVLRPGGWLLFELAYNAVDAVRGMLGTRWSDVEVGSDLAGLPRVLEARLVG
jgi:release factor glutamine methyltransferase